LFGASAVTPVSTSSPEPGLGLETTLQEVPLEMINDGSAKG
jgi:hypothetical protein